MYKLHKTMCTCCSQLILIDKPFERGFNKDEIVANVSVQYFDNDPTSYQNSCGYYTQVCQGSGSNFSINNSFILSSCYDKIQPGNGEGDICNWASGHFYVEVVGDGCDGGVDTSEIELNYGFGYIDGGNKKNPGGCAGRVCYYEFESNPWKDAISINIPCHLGLRVDTARINVIVDDDGNIIYGILPTGFDEDNNLVYESIFKNCCVAGCITDNNNQVYGIDCNGTGGKAGCPPPLCPCNEAAGDVGLQGIAFIRDCEQGTMACILVVPQFIIDPLDPTSALPLFGGTHSDYINSINNALNGTLKIFATNLAPDEKYWLGGKGLRGNPEDLCSCYYDGFGDQFRLKLDENDNPLIITNEDSTYTYIIQARYRTYFKLTGASTLARRSCIPKEQPCDGVIFDPNTNEPVQVPDGCCCEFFSGSGWVCLDHQTCQSVGNPTAISGGGNDFTCFPACDPNTTTEENIVIPTECIGDNIPKNDPNDPDIGFNCCWLEPVPEDPTTEVSLCGNSFGVLLWEKHQEGISGRFSPITTFLYNSDGDISGKMIIE